MRSAFQLHNGRIGDPEERVIKPSVRMMIVVLSSWLIGCMSLARAAETGEIAIEAISKPCMAGSLVRGSVGLLFETCKEDGPTSQGAGGSVRVATLSGEELIYIRQAQRDLVISVRSRALTLRVPGEVLDQAGVLATPRLTLRRLNAATRIWGDASANASLRESPEYALLPELSYQLGKLGISGRAYPPSFLLHAIALGAAEQLGVQPDSPQVFYRVRLPPELGEAGVELLKTLWPDPCDVPQSERGNIQPPLNCPATCEAFPNRDQNCFGMCGPGCHECWPWVCGDCCYHGFCAMHDEIQRACEDTVNPLACLNILPWYFILGGCDELLFKHSGRQ